MKPTRRRAAAIFASVVLSALGLTTEGRAEADALEMMAAVFAGDHTRAEIQAELDRALRFHSLPAGEELYHRAGSVLVALRQATGVGEMDILRCVNGTRFGKVAGFPDAAALCATVLELRK